MENEEQEIVRIAATVFNRDVGGDEQSTQAFLEGLTKLAQQKGVQLVHLGNSLFLAVVKGKGLVEFHTMSASTAPKDVAKDIVALVKYLKNIGVSVAYTYSANPEYKAKIKATKLDFADKRVTTPDGEKYTAYYLDLRQKGGA